MAGGLGHYLYTAAYRYASASTLAPLQYSQLVWAGLLGWLLYAIGVRPFAGRPGMAWVMSTLGFGVILQSIGLAIWGPKPVVVPDDDHGAVVRVAGTVRDVTEDTATIALEVTCGGEKVLGAPRAVVRTRRG